MTPLHDVSVYSDSGIRAEGSREETGLDDTKGESESYHSSEIVDSGNNDGDSTPSDHERRKENRGFRSGEQHVGRDFEHQVGLIDQNEYRL